MRFEARYGIELPVVVAIGNSPLNSKIARGTSENMSLSGLRVQFPASIGLSNGDPIRIQLEVEIEESEFRKIFIDGQVVWNKNGSYGVQILEISHSHRSFYENLIRGYQTLCRGLADLVSY